MNITVRQSRQSGVARATCPKSGTNKTEWKQDCSLKDLLDAHCEDLSSEEQEKITLALDDGLTEEQICKMMCIPLADMVVYHRTHILSSYYHES